MADDDGGVEEQVAWPNNLFPNYYFSGLSGNVMKLFYCVHIRGTSVLETASSN